MWTTAENLDILAYLPLEPLAELRWVRLPRHGHDSSTDVSIPRAEEVDDGRIPSTTAGNNDDGAGSGWAGSSRTGDRTYAGDEKRVPTALQPFPFPAPRLRLRRGSGCLSSSDLGKEQGEKRGKWIREVDRGPWQGCFLRDANRLEQESGACGRAQPRACLVTS